jgi:hypothetical protein
LNNKIGRYHDIDQKLASNDGRAGTLWNDPKLVIIVPVSKLAWKISQQFTAWIRPLYEASFSFAVRTPRILTPSIALLQTK